MTQLSTQSIATTWLEQFSDYELDDAKALLDEVLIVDRDELVAGLNSLLDSCISGLSRNDQRVGIYAERELADVGGKIPAFFKNSESGRAKGEGTSPIEVDPNSQEVGSEGIVANIITDYCRRKRRTAFPHPGPDKLRKKKVRRIVILTDFIGSGNRVFRMLEAFRYVATLRSWRSYRLLQFTVLAYSGTELGVGALRGHELRPDVTVFTGCPTIQTSFYGAQRNRILKLCRLHPTEHASPLGYGKTGSLIVFAHGCPNNAPPVLHSKMGGWKPIFPGRSTYEILTEIHQTDRSCFNRHSRISISKRKWARSRMVSSEDDTWINSMSLLIALRSGARTAESVSARTRIPVAHVEELLDIAVEAEWVTSDASLTSLGLKELGRLSRRRRRAPIVVESEQHLYYPTQLRAP